MRAVRALALIAVVGAVEIGVPAAARASPPPPPRVADAPLRSAIGRALRIRAAERRLDDLLAWAGKDRAESMIDVFTAYTDVELQGPKRSVTVEMLLDLVKDPTVPDAARRRAADAIVDPRVVANDPALWLDGRGDRRGRVRFSRRVEDLLVAADPVVRELARRILEGLWGLTRAGPR